jgi:hypothetical protein
MRIHISFLSHRTIPERKKSLNETFRDLGSCSIRNLMKMIESARNMIGRNDEKHAPAISRVRWQVQVLSSASSLHINKKL